MMSALSLLLVVLLAVVGQGAPTILFPNPDPGTHDYKVAVAHLPLTNTALRDVYDPTRDRSIMASVFMPVPEDTCSNECQDSYMPPQTARIADEQFLLNATSSVFDKLGFTGCCGTATPVDASTLPVVVLEPATDTSRLLYANMARFIAANGVVVITLDHPGETSIVEFPHSNSSLRTVYNSGTVPLSNFSPLTAWNATVQTALDTRVADIKFALGQIASADFLSSHFPTLKFSSGLNTTTSRLNTKTFGIIGHGLGGSVATHLPLTTAAVRFSINLAGTPPLLNVSVAYKTPIYFLGRSNFRRDSDIHWPSTWRHLIGPATEFDIADADMFDFSDLPIVVELAQNEGKMPAVEGRGIGGKSSWASHGVTCTVEGIVRKEVFGDGKALAGCVRNEQMGIVPYLGDVY